MAVPIRAVSGDAAFVTRLRGEGIQATVHSVFTRVVNLQCARDGRLYTLACAGTDNAPDTLVIDVESFDRFGLRTGVPAARGGMSLRVGSALEVDLDRDITLWSGSLPGWPDADMPDSWLRELLERERSSGVRGARRAGGGGGRDALSRTLAGVTDSLTSALADDDLACAYRHGSRLIGLGPGLTPAGDDYVVGLATICHMDGSPVGRLKPLVSRLVQDNADRTNIISRTALTHAARGRVRESIGELASAMVRGDRQATETRGRQVIAIGATSGMDIAAGMLAALELARVRRS